MTLFYGITFILSLLMLPAYFRIDKKRNIWLLLLTVFILISNTGYFALSLSNCLLAALLSNALAYLGNVFLPFFLLMMVVQLSYIPFSKWMPRLLIALNSVVLFITTSGGYLPVYYKEVSFSQTTGLVKVYGPLHGLYKVFILGYFAAIVGVICYAAIKKTAVSTKHTAFLAVVLLGNIGLWLAENMARLKFEFLSISYIMTEALILLLYGILQDFETAKAAEALTVSSPAAESEPEAGLPFEPADLPGHSFTDVQIRAICSNWGAVQTLTQREKEVLVFILERRKRRDIAQVLFVTESTIKKHTSNIYRKLEVTSRTELFEKASAYIS